jgi:hypothetical protein
MHDEGHALLKVQMLHPENPPASMAFLERNRLKKNRLQPIYREHG